MAEAPGTATQGSPPPTAAAVARAVLAHRYSWQDEDRLQEGLAGALASVGLPVEREVRLTGRDRIDLLVGRVGIEVKVDGTAESAARQLQRYAASGLVDELVLVTSRARHRSVPAVLGGKPVLVVVLPSRLA